MALIIFITCQVLPDDTFETNLLHADEKCDFSCCFKVPKNHNFLLAVGQNTDADSLSNND